MFLIRKETAEDIPGIRSVIQAAFGQWGEADLVEALRRAEALTLSAVAAVDSRIIGHIAFSGVTIGAQHGALALAPLAVAPNFQRQGVGTSLVRWSLDECRQLGHGVVLVVGDPAYYGRFGFRAAAQFGIQCPFLVPSEYFMVLELSPGAAGDCHGAVCYRPEFELVDEGPPNRQP